mmetsp:Transcript_6411/g.9798  ORF Transcript_6411/g.9798 Transcript_6411/m.9798 type:complete len:256 (-) Transcript_6411:45-812(-)
MAKIIIFALAGMSMFGGVSAQTHKNGDLRDCSTRGMNTCERWPQCIWVNDEHGEGACYNNCPAIGTGGSEFGTPRDCKNLEGCDLVGYSTRCDFTDREVKCSTANDPDWVITRRQCKALEGCTFNLAPGKNECIEVVDCSSANDSKWRTTLKQCQALDGCRFNTSRGKNECMRDCSSANNSNWITTMSQCQAIKGCTFNTAWGKNECIEDSSTTATAFEVYFSTETDFADEDEDEDEVAQSSESDRAPMPNLRGA